MKNNETYTLARQNTNKREHSKWCGYERDMWLSEGGLRCFYCNSTLKCGLHDCIWREECA